VFKKPNPNSRRPAFLQNGTKANIVFQLTAAVLFLTVTTTKDLYQIHLERKKREAIRRDEEIKKLEIQEMLGYHSEDTQDWREDIIKKLDDLGPLRPGI